MCLPFKLRREKNYRLNYVNDIISNADRLRLFAIFNSLGSVEFDFVTVLFHLKSFISITFSRPGFSPLKIRQKLDACSLVCRSKMILYFFFNGLISILFSL